MSSLSSWRDGPAKQAILDFVAAVTSQDVPVEERVAVFDNDGTLWCEQPMPIQLDFILRRFAEMAEADASLRERQPWKATVEGDHVWFGKLMEEHYAGDDTNVKTLAGGLLAAYDGVSVEDFEESANAFLHSAQHPTLGRGYLECAYAPMVELLELLSANGFANYIVSGGGRDFMRPITQEVYGIPRERVIGSAPGMAYTSDERGGTITHTPALDYLDDGPEKPRPYLEPHRPAAAARRREQQRRHGDARLRPSRRQAVPAPARAPRRRRARVRLHRRRRAGARARRRAGLDRGQHQERLGDRLLSGWRRRDPSLSLTHR